MKHIGIVGSRRRNKWSDLAAVEKAFAAIWEPEDVIVSGGATKGADKFAEMLAFKYGGYITSDRPFAKVFPDNLIIYYPADSSTAARFVKSAMARNTDIARKSDVLIACVHIDRHGGTEDTIKKFNKFHPEGKLILV
jgi:hypothetical protein